MVCLPGEPGAALIGFEVLARPVIQLLAGAEPVFRPSVRAHLLETVSSPGGLREFRPAHVAERRGGGYTVQPLRRRAVHSRRPGRGQRSAGARRAGDHGGGRFDRGCAAAGPAPMSAAGPRRAGRPSLADGPVLLRPYRRGDAGRWSEVRRANQAWLAPWESSPPGAWAETELAARVPLRLPGPCDGSARRGESMPFAVCLREHGRERLVGHINLGNIVRRAFCSAYVGYWVDARVAGRGVIPTALALAVDHAFGPGGLHRVEVNIRPENGPSRRVVEKLGFREEAYHPRYMHIDGAWRDHLGYAMTSEEVAGRGRPAGPLAPAPYRQLLIIVAGRSRRGAR